MKILVIRFSSIGDIVLTTPILRCIKKQQPNWEVHYLCKKKYQTLLHSNPYIDKIHEFDGKLQPIIKQLKQEQFDHIIDLHHNQRSFLIKRALGKPAHVFNKLNLEKWLMVHFKWNRLPKQHIVDRYFEAVKSLGIQNDQAGLDHFIPPESEVNVKAKWKVENYVAFAIGGQHFTKRLPNKKIIEIVEKTPLPVILLGGPEDREVGSKIASKASNNWVLSTCGDLTIHQSASILQQAKWIITHDTGMMHIAAALDKKVISIWGNTIPEFGMTPYPKNPQSFSAIVEVENLSCRPCSKIGHAACPKGHFKCMNQIDIKQITDLIEKEKKT